MVVWTIVVVGECGDGEKWFDSRYGLDVKCTELADRFTA